MADWKKSLFGCFDNLTLCVITYFVPCYTFGKNAEAVGEECLLCGLTYMFPVVHLIAGVNIRGKIRHERGIDGTLCNDLLAVLFCPLCALVQEAQEIRGDTDFTTMGMARE